MDSEKSPKPVHGSCSTLKAVLCWTPSVVFLAAVLGVSLYRMSEGKTPALLAHSILIARYWWAAVNHSMITRLISLVFSVPSILVFAHGVVRRDASFLGLSVFVLFVGMYLSYILLVWLLTGEVVA